MDLCNISTFSDHPKMATGHRLKWSNIKFDV